MRLPASALAFRLGWLHSIRIPFPPSGAGPLLAGMLMTFQPFGPSVTLGLFFVFSAGLALLNRLPARPIGTGVAIAAIYLVVLIWNSLIFGGSLPLFMFYTAYLASCFVFFLSMRSTIASLDDEALARAIRLLLILDLVLNLPPVLLQLGMHGVGDYISGLSGIFNQGALSQGRTNAVRAGMLIVLAMVQYARRKDGVSLMSAGFNIVVLVTALSMTTILSAMAAGMIAILFGSRQRYRTVKFLLVVGMAAVGGIFNQLKYGTSYADYLLALNYHFAVTPKLNVYLHMFMNVLPSRPWAVFVGNGLGNLGDRFTVLFNFENYASYPFKSAIMAAFSSPDMKEHMINKYYLESGVVGNSIVSVPWSSALALFLETGILGIGIVFYAFRRFLADILAVNHGALGSGLFFLAFAGFNSFFDVFADYPETLCPFIIIGLLLARLGRSSEGQPGREASAP